MFIKYATLKLGLQLIERKFAEITGDPSFSVSEGSQAEELMASGEDNKLPTSDEQKRDRSAKVHPPRVIAIR